MIPLSWHKVSAGGEVGFLGFAVNAATGEIGIPCSKLSKALELLDLKKGNLLLERFKFDGQLGVALRDLEIGVALRRDIHRAMVLVLVSRVWGRIRLSLLVLRLP